ncbi:indoleamine 2,3-dioxygenase domain-containing protein [Sarocladium implicatum]|nr:indoleamine 2,3-dioxygenase domain-containing protein [Sarocladium implicatum]
MSPHAITTQNNRDSMKEELLSFSVTRNAFLPQDRPSKHLKDPYYEPWELVAQHLPQLIQEDRIRSAVEALPTLSTDRLRSEADWRRAYVILGFLTHAYVWGGDQPADILPPQITVPFLVVSSHLELPPVLTYAACVLWNFTSRSDDFSQIEDLDTLLTFTGTESESWFYLISVAMEAKASGIIQSMMEALASVKGRDYDAVTESLVKLKECIQDVAAILDRMYERCDPMTFYHHIRPFLAGSKNMEASGLPRGVFYDEGNGEGEWRQLRGGSNGQSSLIQFFDVILGVEHHGHGTKTSNQSGEKSYHEEVRDYMPGPHSRFLTHLARLGSIRELAMTVPCCEEQATLRDAYTAATDALAEFRNRHIQIVTRYIILPSKQPWSGSKKRNLASASSERATGATKSEQLTGTGGTMLVPFLKQARDETSSAGKLQR